MSEYKYQPWANHAFQTVIAGKERTEAITLKHIEMVTRPPLRDFLDYQSMQYFNAVKAGEVDNRWHALQYFVTSAEKALESDDVISIAMAFIALGEAIEALQHPASKESIKMIGALIEKNKKDWPLREINIKKRHLKDIAKKFAQDQWDMDIEKKLRLTQMCEQVWPKLVDAAHENNLTDQLPKGSESIKDWLRPIAPKYAKKGGRPKK